MGEKFIGVQQLLREAEDKQEEKDFGTVLSLLVNARHKLYLVFKYNLIKVVFLLLLAAPFAGVATAN